MYNRYNLNRLAYFVATIEEGTITAAADRLGVSKAVVSKQLQQLEQELGLTLLLRTTRRMQPTEAGNLFYERAKNVVSEADNAFETMRLRGQTPSGHIRVTAPVDYGISHVSPLIARFNEQHPHVTIDLRLSDEQLDLVEQRYDVAFRVGWLKDSSNLARKLRGFDEIVVCSPSTERDSAIIKPSDLLSVPFIVNQALKDQAKWVFNSGKKTSTVTLKSAISMNITTAIRNAVMTNRSFAILPDLLVSADLAEGRLVQLLPAWSLRSGGVFAVTPPGRLRASAVKAFLELVYSENSG